MSLALAGDRSECPISRIEGNQRQLYKLGDGIISTIYHLSVVCVAMWTFNPNAIGCIHLQSLCGATFIDDVAFCVASPQRLSRRLMQAK